MKFNYQKICQNLIKDLPQRVKDVIEQRFGLKSGERKTLEAIGENYGITRERVRQIEEVGFSRLKPKLKENQEVFRYFYNQLQTSGNLRREDILLKLLGGSKFQNQVLFLLTLEDSFKKFYQTKDLHSFWAIDENSLNIVKDFLIFLHQRFLELNRPLNFKEIIKETEDNFKKPFAPQAVQSFLEVSKEIQSGIDGRFGLKDWPEINPRGVRDKAYLIFKREKKPLHFTEITKLINSSEFGKISLQKALVQTVHNELIKNPEFVLVGRGLYALKEWGYQPGVVKDIISMILEEKKKPLTREKVIEEVLKQRFVKVNTILINLNNPKYFQQTSDGKYYLS